MEECLLSIFVFAVIIGLQFFFLSMCCANFFYSNFSGKAADRLIDCLVVYQSINQSINQSIIINIFCLSVNSLQIAHRNCVGTFVSSVQSSVAFRVFTILLFLRKFKVMNLVTFIAVLCHFFFTMLRVYALLGLCNFFSFTNSSTPPLPHEINWSVPYLRLGAYWTKHRKPILYVCLISFLWYHGVERNISKCMG